MAENNEWVCDGGCCGPNGCSVNLSAKAAEEEAVEVLVEDEKQPRLKSWALWVSVLGACWTVCSALGLPEKWGIEEGTFKTIVDAFGTILIGFGILNNPTDKVNF